MDYKFIIMCGGTYPHFKEPRQLIRIHGEPIVARTIRLLREAGITDISISATDERFEQFGVPVLKHENNYVGIEYNVHEGLWCEAFYFTDVPTVYLFGDVVYSPKAIDTIIKAQTDDIIFFGSAFPFAHNYPKPYIEPFGFKVYNTQHLKEAVAKVRELYAEGKFNREPLSWEVWNVIYDPTRPNYIDPVGYIHINDYTCDIDEPSEQKMVSFFERWCDPPEEEHVEAD